MEKSKALLQILKKIPIFKSLSPSQVQKVLGLCEAKTFKEKETICAQGSDSNEMFILISGELNIMSADNTCLATLHPITTVGEMGMFNRHKRSASVVAAKQSKVLVVERSPFEFLLRNETEMRLRIYQNIVEILSGKIVNDNVRARDQLLNRVQRESELRTLRKMLDIAVQGLAKKEGVAADKVHARLLEQVGEQRLNILGVDDEDSVRKLICNSLTDYDVSEAQNGEEALAQIRTPCPDLVIADFRAPSATLYDYSQPGRCGLRTRPALQLS
jgi:CRP-like cAMP-binding protein